MRGKPPVLLALPFVLAALGCGTERTVAPEEPGAWSEGTRSPSPSPSGSPTGGVREEEGEAAFGEAHRIAYPVGAYEHEFSGEADVVYTVDDVSSSEPGRVDFTLEVEVPDLGRVLGLGDLGVVCEAGESGVEARAEQSPGEVEAGTHRFPMWCDVPEPTRQLRIVVEDRGEEMVFTGPVG
jgi:hypothetical protein